MKLIQKEHKAIEFIRKASDLANSMSPDGFHVAFSGGKDSQVLYHLMESSGCIFTAHLQVTTVDPPQLMKFIRSQYQHVQLHLPEINMTKLIVKKGMLPRRTSRFCCQVLKEQAGAGKCVCVGIRASESVNRAKRQPIEIYGKRKPLHKPVFEIEGNKLLEKGQSFDLFDMQTETVVTCVKGSDKIILSPIFHWSNNDVWSFIRGNNIPYCELYDMGFHRIGCMFCPMASKREKALELDLFARQADRIYVRAVKQLMQLGKYTEFDTAEDVFAWWISNTSQNEWLSKINNRKIQF